MAGRRRTSGIMMHCGSGGWHKQEAVIRGGQLELADCYWDDATVTTSWSSGSAAAHLNRGNSGDHRAEATNDEVLINRAYAELPTESNHWIRGNGEGAVWTSDMRLLYRCEKRNGTWKITNMTSVFEMDKLSSVIHGTDLHINTEDLKGLRRSCRWLPYVRIRAGGSVSNDLRGIDRPEEVQKIHAENEAWLAGEAARKICKPLFAARSGLATRSGKFTSTPKG